MNATEILIAEVDARVRVAEQLIENALAFIEAKDPCWRKAVRRLYAARNQLDGVKDLIDYRYKRQEVSHQP